MRQSDSQVKGQFASDNCSGICPEAMEAIQKANHGFEMAYGDDYLTRKACEKLREIFETDCDVYFVFNGTAANSLALAAMCESYHGVITHELSHIETDECGAPQFFSNGITLLKVPGADGKVDIQEVERTITERDDVHYPKPRVISVTQSSELGTVYSLENLEEIHQVAQKHGLKVHMDGARFANAVASLDISPSEITWRVNVDVLCFGGTKNGMPVGEAVVFFDKSLSEEFGYRCKQAGQLASKMRFISAPWVTMLESGGWLQNARIANEAAYKLGQGLSRIKGVQKVSPIQANAVFVQMPKLMAAKLKDRGWRFYSFNGEGHARFMCSWATTDEHIQALVTDLKEIASQGEL